MSKPLAWVHFPNQKCIKMYKPSAFSVMRAPSGKDADVRIVFNYHLDLTGLRDQPSHKSPIETSGVFESFAKVIAAAMILDICFAPFWCFKNASFVHQCALVTGILLRRWHAQERGNKWMMEYIIRKTNPSSQLGSWETHGERNTAWVDPLAAMKCVQFTRIQPLCWVTPNK
jgi:hypothetical protein